MPSNRLVRTAVMRACGSLGQSSSFRGSARALNPESPSTISRSRVRRYAPPRMTSQATSLFHLARILDVLEGLELDIVELAIDLLDLADVDILHDVAGLGVDRDRPARAFPCHPLHGLDQLVAVGVAAGLLQRLIDQVDAVIAADRHEARALAEFLLVGGNEILVGLRGMRRGIDVRGDGTERGVAHAVQQVV